MSLHSQPSAMQEMPFDELTGIEIRAARLDLIVEGDAGLDGVARLMVEPGSGAPTITMRGSRLLISQDGRYGGISAPVLKLPTSALPTIAANISRGNLTLENISASVAINIDSGNLRISDGDGDAAVNVSSGDTVIRQREGNIACRANSGHLSITSCQGNIAIDVSKGDIDIQDCKGEVSLQVYKGDISVVRPIEQNLRISGSKSDVRIQGGSLATADVDVARGDINSSARLLYTQPAETVEETLIADEFEEALDEAVEGLDEEVHFNLGSVEFIANEGGVRVSAGGVERFIAGPQGVRFSRADGTPIFTASDAGLKINATAAREGKEHFRFETGRGSIMIDVAEDQAARVELILNRGDVHSDIPLVEVGRPGPRSSTRRYVGVSDSSETERILLRALTQRGDIHVRLAKPAQTAPPHDRLSTRDRQRRAILDALSQGKLTANEADILLGAMERESS